MIIVTVCTCWLLVFLLAPKISLLSHRLNILDFPDSDNIHSQATPLLGGVLCSLVFLAATIFYFLLSGSTLFSLEQFLVFLFAVVFITGLGLYDDIRGLSAAKKIMLQSIPVSLVCIWLVDTRLFSLPFFGEFQIDPFLGKFLVFLWFIVIINSVNIIDGLDGLLSSFAGVYFLSIGLMDYWVLQTGISDLAFIASAVSFGILFRNWPEASIFLGNSGSNFIGFLIALLPVLSNVKTISLLNYTPFLILLCYPIIDTAYAIARRISKGKHIFQGDRRHLHHLIFIFGRRKKSYLFLMVALFAFNSGLSFLILMDKSYALFLTALCFVLNIGIINSYISRRKVSFTRKEKTKGSSALKTYTPYF